MRDHKGDIKGFTQLSKAWYGDVNLKNAKYSDQIMIGFYCKDGGTSGELAVTWAMLAGELTPRIEIFLDGCSALSNMPELIKSLSEYDVDGKINPTPDEFSTMLESIGFKNLTETEDKHKYSDSVNPLEKEIHEAYRFLRENNNTISDKAIDLMKTASLEYLNK